jgi:ABC-type uncharacterized transport system substrate-binding protein
MNRRQFFASVALMAAAGRRAVAQSQLPVGPKRLGVVLLGGPYHAAVEGLRDGLREAGVEVGRQLDLLVRDANGDVAAAEAAATALERNDAVNAIFAITTTGTLAATRGTSIVPIVFAVGEDPVSAGLVGSMAHPGGRLTGFHFLATDLTAKRLEILREMFPRVRRVATLYDPRGRVGPAALKLAQDAAERLGIEIAASPVSSRDDIRERLNALPDGADAYFFVNDAMVSSQTALIIERTVALRLPTMGLEQSVVRSGVTVAYGADYRDYGRLPIKHAMQVLAGTRPGDLPVETINLPKLSINLKAAKALGLAIPESLLARADEVIE